MDINRFFEDQLGINLCNPHPKPFSAISVETGTRIISLDFLLSPEFNTNSWIQCGHEVLCAEKKIAKVHFSQ